MDIRHAIDTSRMSAYQWVIVAMATFLNALDGYDVLAMAFTATSVTTEFGLSGAQLGWLLSSGLMGMGLGALVLGPLADRYGRRKILLLALALNGVGLLLSSTAGSAVELGVWRVLTGVGVGGMLATITVLTSEYSNNRNRGMAVSVYAAGYGVGATLGGMGATQLIPAFGWRSVFLTGALLTLVGVILTFVVMPESVDHYRTRRPADAARKVERIARRMGLPHHVGLGAPEPTASAPTGVAHLLGGRYRVPTLLLWLTFTVVMFGFYCANTWTPKLLVESGMTEQQGIVGGIMLTLGGTFGSLLYGAITTRVSARGTLLVFILLSAVTLVVFITTTAVPTLAFASGVVVGMVINGCVAGLYTVAPQTYAPSMRTTGVGWGIGVGRIGAITAPVLVGALLDAGWTPTQLYIAVAGIVALGAAAVWKLKPYREVPSVEVR